MLEDPIMKRLDPSAHTRDLETLSKPCQAFNIQWPEQETSFAEMLNVICVCCGNSPGDRDRIMWQ